MLAYERRTTVKIFETLDARLRHEAERRNLIISEITREALEAYFGQPGGGRRLQAAGIGRSGQSDISERIEEILTRRGGAIGGIVIDASPLYAYVDADDAHHASSLALLESHPGPLIVPTLVITEVVYLLGTCLGAGPEVRLDAHR